MGDQPTRRCKICRVLDERQISEGDDRLLSRWHGNGSERMGYRKLAKWLNITLLRREMDRAGISTLGGEAESKYERLRGDDTAISAEVRKTLEAEGIDMEALVSDFVSYGVIRTHIKECLDAERDETTSDWERKSIEITREHATKKTNEAVTSLLNKGEIESSGDISVTLSVELECEHCRVQIPLSRALRRGYVCDCKRQVAEAKQ